MNRDIHNILTREQRINEIKKFFASRLGIHAYEPFTLSDEQAQALMHISLPVLLHAFSCAGKAVKDHRENLVFLTENDILTLTYEILEAGIAREDKLRPSRVRKPYYKPTAEEHCEPANA